MTTIDQPQPDETVRILIPDHPDLYRRLGRAVDFAGALRHANDDVEDGDEPWRLPDQLVAPELQQALDVAFLHKPLMWHVGDDSDEARTETALSHAGVGHMGVYITSLTCGQLQLLTAAAALLTQAETTPFKERTPLLAEIAAFVDAWREADADNASEASLAAWQTAVALLAIAAAAQSATEHRPDRLLDHEGRLVPVAEPAGPGPAADTALLLERIDAAAAAAAADGEGQAREVELDYAGFRAFRRLSVEWHVAIYGAKADSSDALLQSLTY
ncbi:hypothetical protein [Amycolatopsis eburnea]|uniref:Uncharacterized protein n=1 Tax=Amycolatopsis eburnea TaxID=2267691 RepID=A0A3R9F0J5_9PSEU|nr:hypothetical protein [Amycolatopsis eburnea]RSD26410.1 hypothetical protein EIY87_00020 [Amycolatopsis eburnea]